MNEAKSIGAYKSPRHKHGFNFIYEGEIRFGPAYYKVELDGLTITNRTFGFEFKWHPDNKFLALQEWLTTEERKGPITALTLVNLEDRTFARISTVEQGFITPLAFENNVIVYKKEFFGSGKTVEFEIDLNSISNWTTE